MRDFDKRGMTTRYAITRAKKLSPEYTLHKQIAEYLTCVLPYPDVFWATIENSNHTGGTAGMIKQARDKAKGVRAGMPDIIIFHGMNKYFMEVKSTTGNLSPIQKELHAWLGEFAIVVVVRSIEDVRKALKKWQVPTKEVD